MMFLIPLVLGTLAFIVSLTKDTRQAEDTWFIIANIYFAASVVLAVLQILRIE